LYLSWARRSSSWHPRIKTHKHYGTEAAHEDEKKKKRATTPYLEDAPCRAAMDPQRLVQRAVERGAVASELAPELLLPPGVSKRRGIIDGPLHLGGVAGAGGRGLGTVSPVPRHHVPLVPPHESPLLGLGGTRGEANPLVPPGRRGVIIRDLHHLRPGTAGGHQPLCHLHRRLHSRLRGRGRLTWRHGHHLWLRLCNHVRRRGLHPLRLLRS
jgi:hypothetical protein